MASIKTTGMIFHTVTMLQRLALYTANSASQIATSLITPSGGVFDNTICLYY